MMSLTTAMRSPSPHLGTWMSLGSPVISEIASDIGFDWLLFDLEHGSYGETELRTCLQTTRNPHCAAIVRVPAIDPALIARVLDWGAHGIMVPHVSSPEEARAIVRAARYSPTGSRGYSRTVRAYGYGLRVPGDMNAVSPVIMAQIETLEGVRHVSAIAKVEGIDVLFVGPADLNWDISARQKADPASRYQACLRKVALAAAAAGKQCGILVRDQSELAAIRKSGYSVLAIDSDISILRKGLSAIRTAFV